MLRYVRFAYACLLIAGSAAATEHCVPPPISEPLFLRGTMTTWTPREDLQFAYRCNAYVLNVKLSGTHEFRVTDARFGGTTNYGVSAPQTLHLDRAVTLKAHARASMRFDFGGAYVVRLAFRNDRPQLTISTGKLPELVEPPVTDAIAKSLRFDSRDSAAHKYPFGAAPAGTQMQFSLDAAPGARAATLVIEKRRLEGPQEILDYSEIARVPLSRAPDGAREHWRGAYKFDDIGVYGYYFLVDADNAQYIYENNADPIPWTRELGSNGLGAVARATPDARIRRFRQTIFLADYRVPDWAADAVFYYIFPSASATAIERTIRKSARVRFMTARSKYTRTGSTNRGDPVRATVRMICTATISSAAIWPASSTSSTTFTTSARTRCISRRFSARQAITSTTPPITAISIRISARMRISSASRARPNSAACA